MVPGFVRLTAVYMAAKLKGFHGYKEASVLCLSTRGFRLHRCTLSTLVISLPLSVAVPQIPKRELPYYLVGCYIIPSCFGSS